MIWIFRRLISSKVSSAVLNEMFVRLHVTLCHSGLVVEISSHPFLLNIDSRVKTAPFSIVPPLTDHKNSDDYLVFLEMEGT